jgi:hypothetical protein
VFEQTDGFQIAVMACVRMCMKCEREVYKGTRERLIPSGKDKTKSNKKGGQQKRQRPSGGFLLTDLGYCCSSSTTTRDPVHSSVTRLIDYLKKKKKKRKARSEQTDRERERDIQLLTLECSPRRKIHRAEDVDLCSPTRIRERILSRWKSIITERQRERNTKNQFTHFFSFKRKMAKKYKQEKNPKKKIFRGNFL